MIKEYGVELTTVLYFGHTLEQILKDCNKNEENNIVDKLKILARKYICDNNLGSENIVITVEIDDNEKVIDIKLKEEE